MSTGTWALVQLIAHLSSLSLASLPLLRLFLCLLPFRYTHLMNPDPSFQTYHGVAFSDAPGSRTQPLTQHVVPSSLDLGISAEALRDSLSNPSAWKSVVLLHACLFKGATTSSQTLWESYSTFRPKLGSTLRQAWYPRPVVGLKELKSVVNSV